MGNVAFLFILVAFDGASCAKSLELPFLSSFNLSGVAYDAMGQAQPSPTLQRSTNLRGQTQLLQTPSQLPQQQPFVHLDQLQSSAHPQQETLPNSASSFSSSNIESQQSLQRQSVPSYENGVNVNAANLHSVQAILERMKEKVERSRQDGQLSNASTLIGAGDMAKARASLLAEFDAQRQAYIVEMRKQTDMVVEQVAAEAEVAMKSAAEEAAQAWAEAERAHAEARASSEAEASAKAEVIEMQNQMMVQTKEMESLQEQMQASQAQMRAAQAQMEREALLAESRVSRAERILSSLVLPAQKQVVASNF